MTGKHKPRGFSLIEAAIVLAVVGLVIGGIWVAASSVHAKIKAVNTMKMTNQIMDVARKYPNENGILGLLGKIDKTMQPGFVYDDTTYSLWPIVYGNGVVFSETHRLGGYVYGSISFYDKDYVKATPQPATCLALFKYFKAQNWDALDHMITIESTTGIKDDYDPRQSVDISDVMEKCKTAGDFYFFGVLP